MSIKLLIDTDLGGDCDDVGAIALANILQNKNKVEIIGITHTTSLSWGVPCIDIINRYYHHQIKIGANMDDNYCNDNCNRYAQKMAERFYSSYKDRKDAKEAVSFLRKTLSEQDDHSVTIVCIGQLINMARLLKSKSDEYSKYDGVELVKKKVKEFVVMGGLFNKENEIITFEGKEYKSEYNICCDIASAQYFIQNVPTKVIFSDFKCGYQVHTLGPLIEKKDMNNPITFAYVNFQNKARESWDLLTIYYATYHDLEMFSISNNGTILIDDKGITTFDELKQSNHYYLMLKQDAKTIENTINNYFKEDVL